MKLKPLEIKVVHTPIRTEVFYLDEVRKVEKQRDEAFLLLEDLYNSRGELDKVNCKIMRIKKFLSVNQGE